MKVFVCGSSRHLTLPKEKENFNKACQELGKVIAQRKHEIIICSASQNTADFYFIEGLNSIGNQTNVWLYRPDSESVKADPPTDISVYLDGERFPQINFKQKIIVGGWRVVHLRALHDADLVLGIGGSPWGTGPIIYSAEVLEKPLVIIPTFEGITEVALRDLRHYFSTDEIAQLNEPSDGTSQWARKIVDIAEIIKKKNPFRKLNPKEIASKLLLAVGAFIGWFWLFFSDEPKIVGWVYVILMLTFSAISGSVLRYTLRTLGVVKTEWPIANIFIEGLLGLMIAFAIFLIPQGVGIILNDEPAKLETIKDLRRVGGVLSTLSFFSALFIEMAWKRLTTLGTETMQNT